MTTLSSSLTPIILFVYNRLWHTQQTLQSLQNCQYASESELYIFSDAAKTTDDAEKVAQVRSFIHTVQGFKKIIIIEREENYGLAASVIAGVTEVIQRHQKAIVLEDDMIFSEDFLKFINETLHFYQHHTNIFSISGYSYPISLPETFTQDVYLLPRASSWGWATWADRWTKADWQVADYPKFLQDKSIQQGFAQGGKDLVYMLIKQQKGLVNSWAVRWSYTHYKHQAYGLFPRKSKVQNIGNDKSGIHSPDTNRFETHFGNSSIHLDESPVIHAEIIKNLQKFFQPSVVREIINYFKLR